MKDFKDRRKYFYRPWIIRVLVMILAVSGLRGAGRHSPAWNEPSVSCQAVDDLIKQGDDLYKQGRYDEAIAAFTKAIELNSRNGVAFRKRGEAKYGQKDFEGAIVDAGKAILLDPMDYISYNLRGVCLFVLGRYDESLEDCETAISIEPKFADGYINRALIKRVKKDYSGALSDVKKALEIEPGSPAGKVLLKQIEFTMAGGSTAPDSAPPGQDRKFLKVEVRVAPDVTVPDDERTSIGVISSAKFMTDSLGGKKAVSQIQAAPAASQQDVADRLYGQLRDEVKRIANDIGADRKLGAIFDWEKSGIVYRDPSLDLTEIVIQRQDSSQEAPAPIQTNSLKVAVINAQRVLEGSREGKKAISQIQAAPSANQQELSDRLFNKIKEDLVSIVEDIATKNKLGVIFDLDKSGMVYLDSSLDITDLVIGRYDGHSSSPSLNIGPLKMAVVNAQRIIEESREGKKAVSLIQAAPQAAQQQTEERLFEKIRDEVLAVARDMAATIGVNAIFDLGKSGIIYLDKSLDITDSLIARYDKAK